MALPTHSWWGALRGQARQEVYHLARLLADYERVSFLVRPSDAPAAWKALGSSVQLIIEEFDDCWTRDTLPTFIQRGEGLAGVCWKFNGWGQKYRLAKDMRLGPRLLAALHVPKIVSGLRFEGGNVSSDGDGTLLVSESAILHPKRNPSLTRESAEHALLAALGATRVIWVSGNLADHMTDGHVDGIACFTRPGAVLVELPASREHLEYANLSRCFAELKDAGLVVHQLTRPRHPPSKNPGFSTCYINFYIANGLVVMPWFGDKYSDDAARATVEDCFPGRRVVQLRMDAIATGGGGIHCITQQQPAVEHDRTPST